MVRVYFFKDLKENKSYTYYNKAVCETIRDNVCSKYYEQGVTKPPVTKVKYYLIEKKELDRMLAREQKNDNELTN